jgi:hypothetical protein
LKFSNNRLEEPPAYEENWFLRGDGLHGWSLTCFLCGVIREKEASALFYELHEPLVGEFGVDYISGLFSLCNSAIFCNIFTVTSKLL